MTDEVLLIIDAARKLIVELRAKVAEIRDSQTGAQNDQYVKEILEIFQEAKKAIRR